MKEKNIIHSVMLLFLIIILQFGRTLNLNAQTHKLDGGGGGIIAFTSARDGQNEIYLMNADGSSQTRITNTAAGENFLTWSNDGSKLAFRKEGGIYFINILDLPNAVVSEPRLAIAMGGASIGWTPDGQIIFDSPDAGNWDIYLVNTDGSNLINITNNPEIEFDPDVSPDGSKIVFVKGYKLWIMAIDGSNRRQLTNGPMDFAPAWSPDGNQIAFISGTGQQNLEIAIIDADGTNKKWVTNSPYNDEFPSWSPDGLKITYENDTNNKEKIYTIKIDGTEPTQLTNTNFNDGGPDWHPVSNPASGSEFRQNSTPHGFQLFQNYPNPFNPTTNIRYSIPYELSDFHSTAFVSLKVFDAPGKEVATLVNEEKSPGSYQIEFSARDLPSGIYFYRVTIGHHTQTKKMVVIQ